MNPKVREVKVSFLLKRLFRMRMKQKVLEKRKFSNKELWKWCKMGNNLVQHIIHQIYWLAHNENQSQHLMINSTETSKAENVTKNQSYLMKIWIQSNRHQFRTEESIKILNEIRMAQVISMIMDDLLLHLMRKTIISNPLENQDCVKINQSLKQQLKGKINQLWLITQS